jgi:hypothetical protein
VITLKHSAKTFKLQWCCLRVDYTVRFLMCVFMSDKPFDAEACDIGGHASATKGLSDMKTPSKTHRVVDPLESICTWVLWVWHDPSFWRWLIVVSDPKVGAFSSNWNDVKQWHLVSYSNTEYDIQGVYKVGPEIRGTPVSGMPRPRNGTGAILKLKQHRYCCHFCKSQISKFLPTNP